MRLALSMSVLRHLLAPVVLGALGLSAWQQARGVSALLGERLGVPWSPRPVAAPLPGASRPPPSADAILARNVFDSTTGPLLEGKGPGATDPELDPGPPADCTDVRVLGIAAADDPAWSLALLRVGDEHEARLRRAGGEVVSIAADRIVYGTGKPCVARMFRPVATPPPKPPATPAPATRGIVATGPGSYAVDRAARDALIDGAADWMHAISVRPEKKGDEVVGLKIAGLKPGTPLDALGIRAGDVLLSVDRTPLTSPESMLGVLARVRTADRVHAVVLRDGRETQLDFEVR